MKPDRDRARRSFAAMRASMNDWMGKALQDSPKGVQ